MRRYAEQILSAIPATLTGLESKNSEVRAATVKLLQRISLVLLKPKLAVWRYRCGLRSLEDNLRNREDQGETRAHAENVNEFPEETHDEDVPFDLVRF